MLHSVDINFKEDQTRQQKDENTLTRRNINNLPIGNNDSIIIIR